MSNTQDQVINETNGPTGQSCPNGPDDMTIPTVRVFDGPYDESTHGTFDSEFEETYNRFDYDWDPFQLHSFQAINRGDDVLVSAPTSSGKSHVGWYGLKRHLFATPHTDGSRRKVIYTAPIKTLSNEKFEELTEYLGEYGIEPGLLTGDHRVNVESDFLIMTAEILANALFRLKGTSGNSDSKPEQDQSNNNSENNAENNRNQYELDTEFVNSISCVIMDEIHFISDASRGHVWENTLILLESDVQVIGLSATIDEPEAFASWISSTRGRPITLVKKYDRPVPLEYRLYDGTDAQVVMDSNNEYDADAWQSCVKNLRELEAIHKANKTDMRGDMLRSFIKYAEKKDLFQLCFIIFSKRNCERFAEQVTTNLLSGKESAHALKALELKLGPHLKTQENMPSYQQVKRLVQKGVCFHHAGMPVILKEVVEYLYKSGYIKALFATETVAIGVNMPVRTIIFTSLEKASGVTEDGRGSSIRYLNAAEFKQICGRAGRRGKDTRGTVVFLPIYSVPDEMTVRRELLYGPMPKIVSKMDLTYHSYLKTEVSTAVDKDVYFDKSLLKVYNTKRVVQIESEIKALEEKAAETEVNMDQIIKRDSISQTDRDAITLYLKETERIKAGIGGFQIKMNGKQRKKMDKMRRVADKHLALSETLKQISELRDSLQKKRSELEYYTLYKEDRYSQIREYLIKTDYLDQDGLITEYGVMIAHVNECNPFILAEIFTGNILQSMTPIEIIGLCAILTDPISARDKVVITLTSLNANDKLKDAIYYLKDRISCYEKVEQDLRLTNMIEAADYWNISLDYVELAMEWAKTDIETENHSKILGMLNDMDEYEGSFIKNMLKINTIVGNLISLASLANNLELIPKLEQIESMIMKGMVNTDSLHVNI
jgi:superfamily II RNA helicase